MEKITALIMAAGIGSRFGGGIKQLEPVGLHDEIIMDYSIHDAIEAGFKKIVIIIRRDIEEAFMERIGNRIRRECSRLGVELDYTFQDRNDFPGKVPEGRTKPWGTGQAVLAARDLLTGPFVVINADDYYGKEAFQKLFSFLSGEHGSSEYAMAGFILENTLSENGGVTRGICQVSGEGMLTGVAETRGIERSGDGAVAGGVQIDPKSYVSMNMWGLNPSFVDLLKDGLADFAAAIESGEKDPLTAEYLLPIYIDELLRAGQVSVKVLPTKDKWFGVTYREDKESVVASFRKLIADGVYKEELFSDLS